jgi:putative endonuclease
VNRRALGARGEVLAGEWYAERGYTVLDRNWRTRSGELDLVLERNGVVVFCEVKTRTSDAFGIGAEAVTREKQLRIRRLASEWLAAHDRRARELRFDVVSILAPRTGPPTLEVLEAAF